MGRETHGLAGFRLGHAGDLEETRPGLTTATQYSGEPLPEPIRVSAGFDVTGLSGKILIQTWPPRLMKSIDGDTGRFDLVAGDPDRFQGLKAIFAIADEVTAGGLAGHPAAVLSSVFNALWKQHQASPPSVFLALRGAGKISPL